MLFISLLLVFAWSNPSTSTDVHHLPDDVDDSMVKATLHQLNSATDPVDDPPASHKTFLANYIARCYDVVVNTVAVDLRQFSSTTSACAVCEGRHSFS